MEPKYYIDMDGVLAVWNQEASEEETHEEGYFLNRDVEHSAVSFAAMLSRSGAKVSILSSVYQDDHSAREKDEWLNRAGLADIPRIFVPYGRDKHEYVDMNDGLPVLIDDYGKNLKAWEAEGGLAIKFMNGVNSAPKLSVVNGMVQVRQDTWSGYSINRKMPPKQMLTMVKSVAEATCLEAGEAA